MTEHRHGDEADYGDQVASTAGQEFVKYSFFKVDRAWRQLPDETRSQQRSEFAAIVDEVAQACWLRTYSLVGLRADADAGIVYTGVRPGEKLHEELFYASEELVPTGREGILLATSRPADPQTLLRRLNELSAAAQARRTSETLALLQSLVPEYAPPGDVERASAGG